MKILAKTLRGREFMYSRKNVVQVPETWSNERVIKTIEGLNKYFNVTNQETYHAYVVDRYDNIYPNYKALYRNNRVQIIRIS